MEKAPKKSWPGSIIIVADILATISIGRQLRSSMNSDGSSDVSSDYGRYPSGLPPVAMDHPELLRLSLGKCPRLSAQLGISHTPSDAKH